MDRKMFGVRLRKLIQERGIKQKELASKTGMTRQSVSMWVTGERLPSVEVLVKVSRTLNVDIETLLGIQSPKTGEMTANQYQKLAARTINNGLPLNLQESHALHGMVSEIGELHGIYQKIYQGHETDTEEHRKKECGDLCWFLAEYCTANGWKLGDIMQMNVDKLIARYPEGFETEKSLHRAEGDI